MYGVWHIAMKMGHEAPMSTQCHDRDPRKTQARPVRNASFTLLACPLGVDPGVDSVRVGSSTTVKPPGPPVLSSYQETSGGGGGEEENKNKKGTAFSLQFLPRRFVLLLQR